VVLCSVTGYNELHNEFFKTLNYTAKEMWDTLKVMYGNEKNPLRIFEIFERLFELKQGDKSVTKFYESRFASPV